MKKTAGIIFLTAVMIFAGKLCWAADPLVVGPDVYKFVFENERVRVLMVDFAPGAKIAMHSHPDHLVYILSGGKLVLSYPDGTTKDMEGKAGDALWIPAESHAAENVGGTEVKGLVIELKESPAKKVDDSFQASNQ